MTRAEDLAPGDRLLSDTGAFVTLQGLTRTRYSRADLQACRALAPIRFEEAALSDVLPRRTLLLSPDMAVFTESDSDFATRADALVNGGTIRVAIPEEGITYITLRVSQPATLSVGGLRISFGAKADLQAIAQRPLNTRQEEPRVFRPIY